MQKIIIVINNMSTGGIQKSLIALLNEIKDFYTIDMLIFNHQGEYINDIPKKVNIIKENKFLKILGMNQKDSKKCGIFYYFFRGILGIYSKIFNSFLPKRLLFVFTRKLRNYDVAISFTQNLGDKILAVGCNEYILKKVQAKKKVTFVHCDFENYDGNTKYNRKLYAKFNLIACVSNGCKESFVKVLPNLKSKTVIVSNCHDFHDYKVKSEINTIIYNKNYFNIITVSRLSIEKGILRTIDVITKLISEGFLIKWHIVGDGNLKNQIEKIIIQKNLSNFILLYGNQLNPYRFIKNADLFLLPSYHEAAPIVFQEANYLGVPILTTETTSAYEMIKICETGWVCSNDINGIYNGLKEILLDKDKLLKCKDNVMKKNYSNFKAIIEFKKILENDF